MSDDKINTIPNECSMFINVNNDNGGNSGNNNYNFNICVNRKAISNGSNNTHR